MQETKTNNKPIVGIVGWSGTGKSTSLRNLDPATTVIIDLERKGFPFRNESKYRIISCDNIPQFDNALKDALADKSIKVIVIESITKYFEYLFAMCQMANKGFEIFTAFNRMVGLMLNKIKNDHAVVVFTALDEIVKFPQADGTEQARRAIAVKGKEWEAKIEKELLIVFFTHVKKHPDGKMEYLFMTNTDGVCSAKSPIEMFSGQYIPNDLAAALKQMEAYYA